MWWNYSALGLFFMCVQYEEDGAGSGFSFLLLSVHHRCTALCTRVQISSSHAHKAVTSTGWSSLTSMKMWLSSLWAPLPPSFSMDLCSPTAITL